MPIVSTGSSSPPTEEVLESISVEELHNLNEAVATLKAERLLEDEIQELKEEQVVFREVSVQANNAPCVTVGGMYTGRGRAGGEKCRCRERDKRV